eukprot:scaffold22128_cov73-Cyclotella_meneghiniana.AAC.1
MMWSSRMYKIAMHLSPSNITSRGAFDCLRSGISISSGFNYMAKSIGARLDDALAPISNPAQESRRYMSKYLSKSATKRLPLNTKRAKKGYYKGKGGTSEGRLTSKGKFIADPLKKLQLIVPDLTGFALKPYIAKTISKVPPEERIEVPGP